MDCLRVKTMTVQEAIKAVLDLARSEIGYHEKASNSQLNDPTANSGGSNWTKYAEYLDSYAGFYNGPKQSFPWCDVFVDFLFVKTFGEDLGREMLCQPKRSTGAGCLYSAQYYKQAGRWHKNAPIPGDQIFFSYSAGEYSHTGIVEEVSGDTVTTIEGNTSDSVGRRTYNIGNPSIAGYGTPKWQLAEDWVVVQNGQIVNSSEWKQDEDIATAVLYPTPSTENHSWNPPLLRNAPDDYFAAVCVLQGLLNCRNWDSGKVDGYFGPKTEAAVNRARRYFGMDATSTCDKELWEKLGVKT